MKQQCVETFTVCPFCGTTGPIAQLKITLIARRRYTSQTHVCQNLLSLEAATGVHNRPNIRRLKQAYMAPRFIGCIGCLVLWSLTAYMATRS